MPIDRYYIPHDIQKGQSVRLEGQEFHHLAHVTRIKTGEMIELVNGCGILANASVESISKKYADLLVADVSSHPALNNEIILVQAIPRQNRLDFIIEKGTELGMTQIWLFPGQRSERRKFSESQLEHMQAITIAAMKQCGRLYLPKIVAKPSLLQWDDAPLGQIFFGDVSPNAPLLQEIWKGDLENQVLFVIGPESGFSGEEEKKLHDFDAKGVKLHPNILRTDTAALVALSLLAQKMA